MQRGRRKLRASSTNRSSPSSLTVDLLGNTHTSRAAHLPSGRSRCTDVEPARDASRRADRERSFERLYRSHRTDVYRALLRELGNREDAEDVTQTAFLDAYRALSRGGRPEQPRAWLLTIAENARRRRFRTLGRRPEEASLDREPTAAEAEVTVRELRDALELLPPNQRAALVLREVGGFAYAEIAERLGLSVPAVQMLLFRARRALRAAVEKDQRPRRGVGLAWPLPPWLVDAFGSSGGSAGLLPRAAGVVAAGAVGTAVVAGTTTSSGPRVEHVPEPAAQVQPAARARPAPAPKAVVRRPSSAPARPRATEARAAPPSARAPSSTASGEASRPTPLPPAASPRSATPTPPPPAVALPPTLAAPPAPPLPSVPTPLAPPADAPPPPALPEVPPVPTLPTPEVPVPPVPELPVPAPPAGTGEHGGAAVPGLPPS
jgi:RNA polymerase sigma factor (sigma-70 family)